MNIAHRTVRLALCSVRRIACRPYGPRRPGAALQNKSAPRVGHCRCEASARSRTARSKCCCRRRACCRRAWAGTPASAAGCRAAPTQPTGPATDAGCPRARAPAIAPARAVLSCQLRSMTCTARQLQPARAHTNDHTQLSCGACLQVDAVVARLRLKAAEEALALVRPLLPPRLLLALLRLQLLVVHRAVTACLVKARLQVRDLRSAQNQRCNALAVAQTSWSGEAYSGLRVLQGAARGMAGKRRDCTPAAWRVPRPV